MRWKDGRTRQHIRPTILATVEWLLGSMECLVKIGSFASSFNELNKYQCLNSVSDRVDRVGKSCLADLKFNIKAIHISIWTLNRHTEELDVLRKVEYGLTDRSIDVALLL
jgi:hypothetical protein